MLHCGYHFDRRAQSSPDMPHEFTAVIVIILIIVIIIIVIIIIIIFIIIIYLMVILDVIVVLVFYCAVTLKLHRSLLIKIQNFFIYIIITVITT